MTASARGPSSWMNAVLVDPSPLGGGSVGLLGAGGLFDDVVVSKL